MQPYIVVQTQIDQEGQAEIVDVWEIIAANAHKAIDAVAQGTGKLDWLWFASSFGLQFHNPKAPKKHGRSTDYLTAYEDE